MNIKKTLLYLLVLVNYTFQIPSNFGSNPCTWGPDYWCQNTDTMIECNITDCIL